MSSLKVTQCLAVLAVTAPFLVFGGTYIFALPSQTANVVIRGAVGAVAAIVLARALIGGRICWRTIYLLPLIFLAMYTLRVAVHVAEPLHPLRNPPHLYVLYLAGGILMPVLALMVARVPSWPHIGASLQILLTVLAVMSVARFRTVLGSEFGRISWVDEGAGALTLGYLGATVVGLSTLMLVRWQMANAWPRLWAMVGLLSGVVCMGLSGSRGPLMAAGVVGAVCLLCTWRPRKVGQWLRPVGFTCAVVTATWAMSKMGSVALRRIAGTGERVAAGAETRIAHWEASLELLRQHWLFGYGLELPGGSHPHNGVMEAYLALGVFGGTLFLGVVGIGTMAAIRLIRSEADGWLGILFLINLGWLMVSSTLYYMTAFWALLFLVLERSPLRLIPGILGRSSSIKCRSPESAGGMRC